MNERDKAFEEWFNSDDKDHMRYGTPEEEAKRIWDAAFKAGGAQPWWSINQTQWAVLDKKFRGEK